MAYDITDTKQNFFGAIVASLLVVIIRAGQPIMIDPMRGLIIGVVWIAIVTSPFITKKRETKIHAAGGLFVTLLVTTVLAFTFDMVSMEQLQTFAFFGSTPWVLMMLALPTAIFWDRFNINHQFERWYFRRR